MLYSFLPEVTGLDILGDVDDFWTWLHSPDLATLLQTQQEVALERLRPNHHGR
jgi:hypothetical protein